MPYHVKEPRAIPKDIAPGTVYVSQREARLLLGGSHSDAEPARKAAMEVAAGLADTATSTGSSLVPDQWDDAVNAITGLFAATPRIKQSTLDDWDKHITRATRLIPSRVDALADRVEDLYEQEETATVLPWSALAPAVRGLKAVVGNSIERAWRDVIRENADGLNRPVSTRTALRSVRTTSLVAASLAYEIDDFLTYGHPLVKTAVSDLMAAGLVGTGLPEKRHGRNKDGLGVDLASVKTLAEQRAHLTYLDGEGTGVPVFACPVSPRDATGGFGIDTWPVTMTVPTFERTDDGSVRSEEQVTVERPDVALPKGTSLAGFWEISDANAQWLADNHGLLLAVTGGFVTSVWKVVSLAATVPYRSRKVFVVRRLSDKAARPWMGYVPRMRPTPTLVHRPQDS